jgi:hypothetical protein
MFSFNPPPVNGLNIPQASPLGIPQGGAPQVIDSVNNPSALPVSATDQARLQQLYAASQTEANSANLTGGRQLAMSLMQLQELQRQHMVTNQIDQQKANQEGQLSGAQAMSANADARGKMMDFMKQKMLMDASQEGGYDGYMQTLKAIDPPKYTDVMAKQQEINTSIVGQNKSIFELGKAQRDAAVSNLSDLSGILQQVRLAGPKAAQLYGYVQPTIQKIDPNAPNSISGYDDPYVEGGLGLHMDVMGTLQKVGAFNPAQVALMPQETKEGLTAAFTPPGSNPNAVIPGLINSTDQKEQFQNMMNSQAGLQRNQGVPGSSRDNKNEAFAASGRAAISGINNIIQGNNIPLTETLPNVMKSPVGQELGTYLKVLKQSYVGIHGDSKDVDGVMPGVTDHIQNVLTKTKLHDNEFSNLMQNTGVNKANIPSTESGLTDPSSGQPVKADDLQALADKYHMSYADVVMAAKNMIGQGK